MLSANLKSKPNLPKKATKQTKVVRAQVTTKNNQTGEISSTGGRSSIEVPNVEISDKIPSFKNHKTENT